MALFLPDFFIFCIFLIAEMKLSLFMPTHYTGALHYASIFSVIRAASDQDFEVVISDNSNDDEKFELLKRFESENVHVYRGPTKDNHLFALEKTTADYVMPIGDDDLLLPAGLQSIMNELAGHRDASGGCGLYGRDLGDSYDFLSFSSIDQQSFLERIKGVVATIPWGNPLFHTVVRRDILKKSYEFMFGVPNLQSFHDHLATLFIASSGVFRITNQPYFIYNYKNWVLLKDRIDSELRILRAQNLPPSLVLLQRLILAVEGFYLLQAGCFLVPDEDERRQACALWFSEWFNLWIASLSDGYGECDEVKKCKFYSAVNSIVNYFRLKTAIDAGEVIEKLAALYNEINGSGDRYKKFWMSPLACFGW